MKKSRKKYARLGKVAPTVSVVANPKLWTVKADSKCVHFQQLWSRDEKYDVQLSDVLDFAINRNLKSGDREFRIGLSSSGIYMRETGSMKDIVITFPDLISLIQGQSVAFPTAS
jgi:hypothetical protein